MAEIIPNGVDPNNPSKAEIACFKMFQRSAIETQDWVVLHSVITRNQAEIKNPADIQLYEADFIVIIPEKGFFVLEVKGGDVKYSNGVWTQRGGELKEDKQIDPQAQAKRVLYELRIYISRILGVSVNSLPASDFAVVTPTSILGLRQSPGFVPENVIDKDDIDSFGLVGAIKRLSMLTKKPIPFSSKQVLAIRDTLARRVSNIELIRTQIEHSEKTIVRLTAEQFERLDDITLNRASIVKGAAGTGKTMLASELYKRACEDGERTLFVCYNRLLGRRLKKDCFLPTTILSGKSQVGSIHAVMLSWIEKTDYIKQLKALKAAGIDDSVLFGTHYPELAAKAAGQLGIQFDYLIVDEAQDIMTPSYISMFDKVLKGGLRNGRWSFFGDFEKQAIYGACDLASVRFEIELVTGTQPPVLPLSVNCRNTDSIITETAKISGFSRIPSLPQNDLGPEVLYQKYGNETEATDAVEKAIALLINEVGIPASKIVVISPRRFNKSAARNVGAHNGFTLIDCDTIGESSDFPLNDRTVMFSTVHSFKGMEAMAVILCDVEDVTSVEAKSLMYVAMSRATSRLHVICARSVWNDVIECKNKKLL